METDFIVIGSGLAGLTSSLILSKYGKVLLVTKSKLSDGATNWAQGGIACAVSENDSWRRHMKDTRVAGAYHNDKKAVEFLVRRAKVAIDWLSEQGVHFEKSGGHYKAGREGGHSYNRILHATDFTGKEIEVVLTKKLRKNKNIKIWENAFANKLLVAKGRCYGVQIMRHAESAEVGIAFLRTSQTRPAWRDFKTRWACSKSMTSPQTLPCSRLPRRQAGHPLLIDYFSKAVVLATGGLGQIYEWTTNPFVATGDGIAMAYRAGAKLKDLEFIQFHPTALKPACPPADGHGRQAGYGRSPLFLLSEAIRGEGGRLVRIKNKTEERFMDKYDKRMELTPRDIVARAIFNEQQKGFEVYLDIRHKGKEFLKSRFPNIYKELKKRRFDLAEDLIPVTPAAHFSCGGVETDLYGRTNIGNLFAFGEVACTGVHGANRLASNSLLESVVFPLKLAINSQSLLRSAWLFCAPPKLAPRLRSEFKHGGRAQKACLPADSYFLIKVRKNLQHLMWKKVGIVRTKSGLKKAKEQLIRWENDLKDLDYASRELLEVKNMILVAKLITEAALRRKRSLGTHSVKNRY